MSCEHLVCASCAGHVVDGRCPVCRAGRARLHHHGAPFGLAPELLLVVVGLLTLLAVLAAGR